MMLYNGGNEVIKGRNASLNNGETPLISVN